MTTTLLKGTVQQGGTINRIALPNVRVTVYQAGTSDPRPTGQTTTGSDGTFSVNVESNSSSGIFYAVADLGYGVKLATAIGPTLPASITINELTTVAAAFAFAQFIHDGMIAGNEFGLSLAAGMNNNLVSPVTGESSDVLLLSPNGDETNSLRSTRSLANLLSLSVLGATVDSDDAAQALFEITTPLDALAPKDTIQALVNIALNPANNAAAIYAQSRDLKVELYEPALESMPDAWTITVKVNRTGNNDVDSLFGGPGNIAFDNRGYAWISNNVVQGTPGSNNNLIVLQPNGKPSDGTNNTPRSPLTGGGLLGGGFGVAIDPSNNVWVGNFGWGNDNPVEEPPGSGSVSKFSLAGESLSNPDGYYGGTWRVQAMASDQDGNIWSASFGNDRVVVFPKGDHTKAFWYPNGNQPAPKGPFGIAIAQDGTAWVANSGGLTITSVSSLSKYEIVVDTNGNYQLEQQFNKELGHSLKGLSLDSQGNCWVASGGDNAVYLFSPTGELLGKFNGGGLNCPWSATVDGDDHCWVSNFGPMRPGMNFTSSRITKLAGTNPATLPPKLKTGDPISPPTGYTVSSAGAEVQLANHKPLYGEDGPKCFNPLMRITNCCIDQAGNIWAINNWKPDFDIDISGNPGGDGIVIFVGLAKPPTI
jgi:hypothetical protein